MFAVESRGPCDKAPVKTANPRTRKQKQRICLSKAQVQEICEFKKSDEFQNCSITAKSAELAQVYGVCAKTIRDIWNGRTWMRSKNGKGLVNTCAVQRSPKHSPGLNEARAVDGVYDVSGAMTSDRNRSCDASFWTTGSGRAMGAVEQPQGHCVSEERKGRCQASLLHLSVQDLPSHRPSETFQYFQVNTSAGGIEKFATPCFATNNCVDEWAAISLKSILEVDPFHDDWKFWS